MTAEAKIPSEDTNWQAIDIFVFSNGEEYSPPRKYHLNAQELNWWTAILHYLAKSQYGPLHSTIDLYTVEGEKLEGPLQLSNGAAYVAVKPLDQFIETGYSKYLLKASRSWEKSQARRSNSIEITKPDDNNDVKALSNGNVCNETVKQELIASDIISNISRPSAQDTKIIERPQALMNVLERPQRDSSVINRPTDKRRVSPIQRSSILRKPMITPSITRKDAGKNKEPPKNGKELVKVNEKSANGGNVPKSKGPQKILPRVPPVKPEVVSTEEKYVSDVSDYSNCTVSMVDKVQNDLIHEKINSSLVSNIYKNPNSDITSAIVPLSSEPFITAQVADNKPLLNDISEEHNSNVIQTTADIQKTDLEGKNTRPLNLDNDLSNQKILHLNQMQKTPNVSFAESTDKNYVIVNNGDVVNLKLQIEVRNAPRPANKTEQKTYSYTNISKTEKGSQINLDNEMSVQNKSLQSIFKSDFADSVGVFGNTGPIIIKCACCQERHYTVSKINTETSANDSKMYVVLLPSPDIETNLERCQCVKKVLAADCSQSSKPSIINTLKKTTSTTILEVLDSKTDAKKEKSHTKSEQSVIVPNVPECIKIESIPKHHVAIANDEVINSKDVENNNSNVKCSDNIDLGMNTNTTKTVVCNEMCASATQTDLCSLVLEARRHEDGRYSFYLPPLHILKYYRL